MDWLPIIAIVVPSLLGGGVIVGLLGWRLNLWQFRHQTEQDKWAGIQQSFKEQIDSSEKRGDQEKANQVRLEYEAQLEAWRAQQGVESLAPRSISADRPTTLTATELERLRALLAESQVLNPAALVAESHWLRGNAYYDSKDYNEAVNSYTQALRLRPNYPEAYYNRGTVYGFNLRQSQKAVEDFTQALHLRPDYPEAYNNRGIAYGSLGEHQKAIADFNEALRLRPEFPEAYHNRGNAYGRLGVYDMALADHNEALRLRPNYPEVYYNRGTAYERQEEHEKAVEDFNEALHLRSEFPEAYYNRGNAYYNLGEHEKAVADYNEALRLRPGYASAYYNLACLHSLQEDIEPCVANLERAIALDESLKEMGRTASDLEWARQDSRVRNLLGLE